MLGQSYFMSFCLTCTAAISRFYVLLRRYTQRLPSTHHFALAPFNEPLQKLQLSSSFEISFYFPCTLIFTTWSSSSIAFVFFACGAASWRRWWTDTIPCTAVHCAPCQRAPTRFPMPSSLLCMPSCSRPRFLRLLWHSFTDKSTFIAPYVYARCCLPSASCHTEQCFACK